MELLWLMFLECYYPIGDFGYFVFTIIDSLGLILELMFSAVVESICHCFC